MVWWVGTQGLFCMCSKTFNSSRLFSRRGWMPLGLRGWSTTCWLLPCLWYPNYAIENRQNGGCIIQGHCVSFPPMGPLVWLLMLGDGSFSSFPVHRKRIIWIRFRNKRIRVDGALTFGAVGGSWKRCLRSSHSPSLSKTKLKRPIAGYVWPHSPILIVSFFIAGDSFTRIKRAFVESKVKHFCWVGLGYIKIGTMKPLLWATSIQEIQNWVPEKCSYNLCICYLYWRDTSIQGEETIFLGYETLV